MTNTLAQTLANLQERRTELAFRQSVMSPLERASFVVVVGGRGCYLGPKTINGTPGLGGVFGIESASLMGMTAANNAAHFLRNEDGSKSDAGSVQDFPAALASDIAGLDDTISMIETHIAKGGE